MVPAQQAGVIGQTLTPMPAPVTPMIQTPQPVVQQLQAPQVIAAPQPVTYSQPMVSQVPQVIAAPQPVTYAQPMVSQVPQVVAAPQPMGYSQPIAPQAPENHFVRNVPIYENDPRRPQRPSIFTTPTALNAYDDFRARTNLPGISLNQIPD